MGKAKYIKNLNLKGYVLINKYAEDLKPELDLADIHNRLEYPPTVSEHRDDYILIFKSKDKAEDDANFRRSNYGEVIEVREVELTVSNNAVHTEYANE